MGRGDGGNPSYHDGKKDNAALGMDTSRFPVENVSWHDCQDFLKRLNGRGGAAAALGRPGQFALPHEDQWEYACRGGLGNRRPFYFGDALDGTQANCDGLHPFGSPKPGPYPRRPAAVGRYAAVAPHPWGLCDMHGNILEWCANDDGRPGCGKNQRGGAFDQLAAFCRSAHRYCLGPETRTEGVGFRVAFLPD